MRSAIFSRILSLAERGLIPDSAIRIGIRQLLASRLRSLPDEGSEHALQSLREFLAHCDEGPIAIVPERANEQHYEVPSEFFRHTLGPRLKYSCCFWDQGTLSLSDAERSALTISCRRAELADHQEILELGCGWGSLTLWMAEHYPRSRIVAVSNSRTQREFIEARARDLTLTNVKVVTADMNHFNPQSAGIPPGHFDRVVSIEMFEHMRNQRALLGRVSRWLKPDGRLFVHVFCHRAHPYLFEEHGPADWMTRHFFAGGMMPSESILLYHQQDLELLNHWRWSGKHYERTSNAWLKQMDAKQGVIDQLLHAAYGVQGPVWRQRWRIFFMACAELFGFRGGREWFVSHYLFRRRS